MRWCSPFIFRFIYFLPFFFYFRFISDISLQRVMDKSSRKEFMCQTHSTGTRLNERKKKKTRTHSPTTIENYRFLLAWTKKKKPNSTKTTETLCVCERKREKKWRESTTLSVGISKLRALKITLIAIITIIIIMGDMRKNRLG